MNNIHQDICYSDCGPTGPVGPIFMNTEEGYLWLELIQKFSTKIEDYNTESDQRFGKQEISEFIEFYNNYTHGVNVLVGSDEPELQKQILAETEKLTQNILAFNNILTSETVTEEQKPVDSILLSNIEPNQNKPQVSDFATNFCKEVYKIEATNPYEFITGNSSVIGILTNLLKDNQLCNNSDVIGNNSDDITE